MNRILIGSSIRQDDDEILSEYASALAQLKEPRGAVVDHHFVIHNPNGREIGLLKKELPDATFEIASFETGYIPSSHHWPSLALRFMADVKTHLLERMILKKYGHLFWVDSDLLLHPRTLIQLLKDQKDLVATIFWTVFVDQAGNPCNEGKEAPNCWFFSPYSFPQDVLDRDFAIFREPGLYRVGGTGGAILISKQVALAGVTFKRLYHIPEAGGEDRDFATRAIAHDFELFVDTRYPAFHIYTSEKKKEIASWKKSNR